MTNFKKDDIVVCVNTKGVFGQWFELNNFYVVVVHDKSDDTLRLRTIKNPPNLIGNWGHARSFKKVPNTELATILYGKI